MQHLQSKILNNEVLQRQLNQWRFKSQTIVFTNGCFDLLHQGHLHTLCAAANMGDQLIVGLNSDASVRKLKGENRPVKNEQTRALLLAAMQIVAAVVIFDEPTPLRLIKTINPQVLVKGGDYKIDEIVGAKYVVEKGGRVEIVPYLPNNSTTVLINRFQK